MVAATTLTGFLVSALLASARPAQEAQHPFGDDHHSGPINPLKRRSLLTGHYLSTEAHFSRPIGNLAILYSY